MRKSTILVKIDLKHEKKQRNFSRELARSPSPQREGISPFYPNLPPKYKRQQSQNAETLVFLLSILKLAELFPVWVFQRDIKLSIALLHCFSKKELIDWIDSLLDTFFVRENSDKLFLESWWVATTRQKLDGLKHTHSICLCLCEVQELQKVLPMMRLCHQQWWDLLHPLLLWTLMLAREASCCYCTMKEKMQWPMTDQDERIEDGSVDLRYKVDLTIMRERRKRWANGERSFFQINK